MRLRESAALEQRRRVGFTAKPIFGRCHIPFAACIFAALLSLCTICIAQQGSDRLELSRPVRPWEFLSALGTRAGLFGHENGDFEAWVYPLKLVRNFHLRFLVNGRVIPAEGLARTITVRPESTTIIYADDDFTVHETLFVPVHEAGAVVILDVQTSTPLQVEAAFQRDFQLQWPAALGGTYINWDANLHGFLFGEEQKKYAAVVGSPSAVDHRLEYFTSYTSSREDSFVLAKVGKPGGRQVIVLAGSVDGAPRAQDTYHRLSTNYSELLKVSENYYETYLDRTVALQLPDTQLQQAYDWSRISMIQGLVTNPFLGTGLIAGYRTSGNDQRPGFAWFFGRDSFWTSLALNADGDFNTARLALDFISKYQRADGKIPHEISQTASLVPWFTHYPYPYASADATPLFIIATNDYVTHSGDVAFAQLQWGRLWKAYEFLRSTSDAQGFAQNLGIGHGWVEGGPLLPVKTEFYQSGLGVQALQALANLAGLVGKNDVRRELQQDFARQRTLLNQAFWSADQKIFAFALNQQDQRVETPSILAAVPMWFGLADQEKAEGTINGLSGPEFQTDWGSRIISSHDPKYNPAGYHFGAVWPLFTGWESVAAYRYHRSLAGYEALRANSLLALNGSPGHVTEVLSGDYYEPLSTSSPDQIWSAAMVVSPILRGMLGLEVDAISKRILFAPHLPADWSSLGISNVRVGNSTLRFAYHKTADRITLQISRTGTQNCTVEFAPSFSLRANNFKAEVNGHPVPVQLQRNTQDEHALLRFSVAAGQENVVLRFRDDFGLKLKSAMPALGARSNGLRVTGETWNARRDSLTLDLSGLSSAEYELDIFNPSQITLVKGASFRDESHSSLDVKFPQSADRYTKTQVTIYFAAIAHSATAAGR